MRYRRQRWIRDQVAVVLAVVMLSTVVVVGALVVEPAGAVGSEPVVHFVVDVSGSMRGEPLDTAKLAMTASITALPDGVAMGLRSYEGTCSQPSSPLVPIGVGNEAQMLAAVDDLKPLGGTPTSVALQLGIDELDAYPTTGEKRIVLLTDGDNQCPSQTNPDKLCPIVANSLSSGIEFSLYTVGLGAGLDVEDFECAAEATGGEYLPSPTPADLAEKISEAVTSGSYVWPLWRFFGGGRESVVGAGDPVGTAYGNFFDTFVDLPATAGVFGLEVSRSYNSLDEADSVLGRGWRAPFSATAFAEGDDVRLTTGDGRQVLFEGDGSGGWEKALEFDGVISKPPYSGFRVTFSNGERWDFDGAGRLKSLTSWDGQTTTISRNYSGDPVSAVSSLGPSLSFSYSAGHLAGVASSDGRTVSYAYDLDGDLASVADPAGGVTTYVTDGQGRITSITDPTGVMLVSNVYDSRGRVKKQTTPDSTSTFEYNYLAKTTTVTLDPGGEAIVYTHDDFGRVVRITDAEGKFIEKDYDPGSGWMSSGISRLGGEVVTSFDSRGNPLSVLDATGALTSYTYDSFNRVISVDSATTGLTSFTYVGSSRVPSTITDANSHTSSQSVVDGLVTSLTDADGVVTEFRYNSLRQLVEVEDAYGNITSYEYDAVGRRTATVSALGNRSEVLYDAAGRPAKTTAPDGGEVTTVYDAAGRVTSVTDEVGAVESYTYDPVTGQVAAVSDKMGRVTSFVYDDLGQLTKTIYADASFTESDYGILGRVMAERDELGRQTSYGYDGDGNVSSVTDPAGGVAETLYDSAGRVAKETDPLDRETLHNYAPSTGLLASVVSPDGTISYAYDNLGRVVSTTDYRGGVSATFYTPGGRVASEIDPVGLTTSYSYDNAGRPWKTTAPGGLVTTTAYDADSRVVSVTSPGGLVSTSSYDQVGRVVSSTDPTGVVTLNTWNLRGQLATSIRGGEGTVRYSYLADGQLDWVEDALGHRTTFGYDARGRQINRTDAKGKVWSTGLNAAGETVSESDPLGRVTTYSYDPAGRVATVSDPSGREISNTWSADGSLASWEATKGTETTATSFTYDAAGRRVGASVDGAGWTYAYTPGGDLASVTDDIGRTLSYSYDQSGRRTKMRRVDGTGVSYGYDAAGRVKSITPTEVIADSFTSPLGKPDPNKWFVSTAAGGSVGIVDNKAVLGASVGAGFSSWIESKAAKAANGNSTFTYKFASASTPAKLNIYQKYQSWTDNYRLEITSNNSTAKIIRTFWGGETQLSSFTVPVDTDTHNVRFTVEGNWICAKIWNPGTAEPTTWSNCASDGWLIGQGSARIEVGGASGAPNSVTIDDFSHNIPGAATAAHVNYTWDGDGHLTGETLAGGANRTWTWTGGRLTKLQQSGIPGAHPDTTLTYDATGRIKTEATGSRSFTYAYDQASQLVSSTPNTGTATSWTYDNLGRRVSQQQGTLTTTYDYDNAGQLTSATPASGPATVYSHDGAGRRTNETTGTATTSYTYDPAGRLAQTELPDGDLQYRAYDPNGSLRALINLVDSTHMTFWHLDWDPTTGPTEPVSITKREAGGDATATNLTRLPGTPWATSDSGPQRNALATDIHGSTRPTPLSGLGQADSYTPWGQPATLPADALTPKLGYRGELTTIGQVHLRARQYDPNTGTFTTTDPLPGVNGTTTVNNPYHYTNNNPLNLTDPTGLRALDRIFFGWDWRQTFEECSASAPADISQRTEHVVRCARSSPGVSQDQVADRCLYGGAAACALATLEAHGFPSKRKEEVLRYFCYGPGDNYTGSGCDFGGVARDHVAEFILIDLPAGAASAKVVKAAFAATAGRSVIPAKSYLGKVPNNLSTPGVAVRQVGRQLESVDDVLANPWLLAGRSPAEVQAVIGRTSGWQVETLGRGSRQGQGWVLREYTSAGNPTGRMLRWHPGGGHHGPGPYWRVTDFNKRSEIIR